MKIQLKELEQKIRGLEELSPKKLPVRLAYAISKNRKVLADEYEMMLRQWKNILEQNCLRDEEGSPIIDENREYQYTCALEKENVLKAVSELLNTQTELAVMTVPLVDIEKCDETGFDILTGVDMAVLEFMIEA